MSDSINEDELNKTLSKLNELESKEDEIDNIIENPEGEIEKEEKKPDVVFSASMLVNALGSLSKIASRKFQIKEIELTEEDKQDLTNALLPFEDKLSELIKYLPYMPLVIFSIGYIGRVYIAYKDKKTKEKEMKKELKQENKEIKQENLVENEIKNEKRVENESNNKF